MQRAIMERDGKHILSDSEATQVGNCGVTPVLSVLEQQLVRLDQMGASLAAAHLDAAIQQLRLDQANGLHSAETGNAT